MTYLPRTPKQYKMRESYNFKSVVGPYQEYVRSQCSQNPSLLYLLNFLSNPRPPRYKCQIVALDFQEELDRPVFQSIGNTTLLCSKLREMSLGGANDKEEGPPENHLLQGRILIVEDLTADVVEILGCEMDIDPLFFAMHLHTAQKKGMSRQSPESATLPSRLISKNYANINYHRAITFNTAPPGLRLLRDSAIDRKVVVLPSTTIALPQHCASVLYKERKTGSWIAVILVDPPINDRYISGEEKDPEREIRYCPSQPFLGPYEDFMDPPSMHQSKPYEGFIEPPSIRQSTERSGKPSHQGMSQDLQKYWARSIPACFDPRNPTLQSLAYYPLRIVAAEWVKYVAVMHASLKHYEYSNNKLPTLLDELDKLNSDLRGLQGWRRRSLLSQQKVRSVIRLLKSRDDPDSDLQSVIQDFEFIGVNIEEAGRRLESMLPVVTSLVQVVDARRSFAETANITRLTFLALVFIPLSYVSSLFSMTSDVAPGGQRFWVYFAVAIPVTLLVFLIARPPRIKQERLFEWYKTWRKPQAPSRGGESSANPPWNGGDAL